MPDLNKPIPLGPIPYGFHVKTKNGNALVIDFLKPNPLELVKGNGPMGFIKLKVLYGIADNRRYEDWILLSEITAWQDEGIGEGAYFQEYREVI